MHHLSNLATWPGMNKKENLCLPTTLTVTLEVVKQKRKNPLNSTICKCSDVICIFKYLTPHIYWILRPCWSLIYVLLASIFPYLYDFNDSNNSNMQKVVLWTISLIMSSKHRCSAWCPDKNSWKWEMALSWDTLKYICPLLSNTKCTEMTFHVNQYSALNRLQKPSNLAHKYLINSDTLSRQIQSQFIRFLFKMQNLPYLLCR